MAAVHHCDAVRHGHGFYLVVCHINGGDAEVFLQVFNLAAHSQTKARIQIGQGLVKEQHIRFLDQSAPQGDPLLLPAG